MDIERERKSMIGMSRRKGYVLAATSIVIIAGAGVTFLRPAAPTVERASVWVDTVKRGSMLRQVRGVGTLVPEESAWLPASTDGRVVRILAKVGARVTPETVVLEMTNPEVEQKAVEAGMRLKEAEAELANLRVQLETQRLNQEASAAMVRADHAQARMQAEVDEALVKEGLISDLLYRQAKVHAEELATRNEIEQKRLAISAESVKAQLDVQMARVEQERARTALARKQLDALHVRGGIDGVLQETPVEAGQQVTAGTNLARVADPARLKAQVRVPETLARDVAIGQATTVDTRNGLVQGRVSRIDPSVRNGTVTVDIELRGELPRGVRPDLSVDGTIEIVRLDNIVHVGRPAFVQEGSTVGIYKLGAGGRTAVRVPVKFGRSSINTIEIVEGLKSGDQVILSDMSQWSNFDRLRLR